MKSLKLKAKSLKVLAVLFLSAAISFVSGCTDKKQVEQNPEKSKDWLASGATEERFSKVSRHLRGFDMAMAEVGYRFSELYWAGQDKNWEFAKYHLEKIRTTIKNGIERRPKRAQSAQMIYPSLDALEKTVILKDPIQFKSAMKGLKNTCNACHSAEKVPFIHVEFPLQRLSPIKFSAESGKDKEQ
ncbi:MAG: hypothetical protein KF789_01885 [Bdellovibrionaceae bacterium]|nr:hypothetical protein [Pseudobdellovibrionaceae bacterium]